MSPFEFAHGFMAHTPLILGVIDDRLLPVDMKTSKHRQDYDHTKDTARKVLQRHQAAADHMVVAQVRLGQMLAKRVDLPPLFGKTRNRINMSRLKIFEARDAEMGEADTAPEPLLGYDGVIFFFNLRVFIKE